MADEKHEYAFVVIGDERSSFTIENGGGIGADHDLGRLIKCLVRVRGIRTIEFRDERKPKPEFWALFYHSGESCGLKMIGPQTSEALLRQFVGAEIKVGKHRDIFQGAVWVEGPEEMTHEMKRVTISWLFE